MELCGSRVDIPNDICGRWRGHHGDCDVVKCFFCSEPLIGEAFVVCVPEPDGTPDEVEACGPCKYGPNYEES